MMQKHEIRKMRCPGYGMQQMKVTKCKGQVRLSLPVELYGQTPKKVPPILCGRYKSQIVKVRSYHHLPVES